MAREVVDSAIAVHRALGPGFRESVYERALCIELAARGVSHARQVLVQLTYRDQIVGTHRVDLVVEGLLVVELKTVDLLGSLHMGQVIAYLKATNLELGLLINFNVPLLHKGVRRIVLSR
ncbi:MAG: hypothetical protein JWP97_474 [Labilithrix sp.]|nr:hypothetical protein [Labilithrix sp.]